ncbi:MAG: molybdenum cofactor guanylyltransferase [Vicinamibacterales bacterium]
MSDITAAILVGGKARRFNGAVKPALKVGERTILERQLAALDAAGIHEILLVGSWRAPQIPGVRHVADAVEEPSALGGMYSALLVATSSIVVVLAGDLPFLEARFLSRLTALEPDEDAAAPRIAGRWHPLCAAYRRRVAPGLKRRLDRSAFRVSDALTDMHVRELTAEDLAPLDGDGMLLMNVNTPDDHQRAARRARFRS